MRVLVDGNKISREIRVCTTEDIAAADLGAAIQSLFRLESSALQAVSGEFGPMVAMKVTGRDYKRLPWDLSGIRCQITPITEIIDGEPVYGESFGAYLLR